MLFNSNLGERRGMFNYENNIKTKLRDRGWKCSLYGKLGNTYKHS